MRHHLAPLLLIVWSTQCLAFTSHSSCYRRLSTSPRLPKIHFYSEVDRDASDHHNDDGATPPTADGDGASIPNLTISLVKSVVGSGVLALPAGVAALGGNTSIIPLALVIVGAIGALNAFFFSLLGRICSETGAKTYKSAWERTMGTSSSQIVAATVTFKTALTCLAYSMILADSVQSLLQTVGLDLSRTASLLAVTLSTLVPLTLQRNLASLAPFSFLGLVGIFGTGAAILFRSLDGSYSLDSGRFVNELPLYLQPSFQEGGPSWRGVVLACTLATAFVAHYNAPRFHAELRDNTVKRFNTVVYTSFLIAALFFGTVAVSGFGTFGTNTQGFILNNYATSDPIVTVSKFALAASMILTYPLPFVGLRDGVLDMFRVDNRSDTIITISTLAILALVTTCAASVTDLALVLSVGGGTFSTAVSSVFPALMFRARETGSLEAKIALVGMILSIVIGVTGVAIALGVSL